MDWITEEFLYEFAPVNLIRDVTWETLGVDCFQISSETEERSQDGRQVWVKTASFLWICTSCLVVPEPMHSILSSSYSVSHDGICLLLMTFDRGGDWEGNMLHSTARVADATGLNLDVVLECSPIMPVFCPHSCLFLSSPSYRNE